MLTNFPQISMAFLPFTKVKILLTSAKRMKARTEKVIFFFLNLNRQGVISRGSGDKAHEYTRRMLQRGT